jgi:hypothetical protein
MIGRGYDRPYTSSYLLSRLLHISNIASTAATVAAAAAAVAAAAAADEAVCKNRCRPYSFTQLVLVVYPVLHVKQ